MLFMQVMAYLSADNKQFCSLTLMYEATEKQLDSLTNFEYKDNNQIYFSMKFLCANRIAPDGTLHSAASNLGLFCLPIYHKRYTRLV